MGERFWQGGKRKSKGTVQMSKGKSEEPRDMTRPRRKQEFGKS
jgi:hypothetical protein